MFDILISFRTTFQNPYTGDEETNGWVIFNNYFFGRFWIDLFSTLPFEAIVQWFPSLVANGQSSEYSVISCLKLFRILRLGRLINYLNSSDDFKQQLRLIKLIFFLMLYIHFCGCMWFFVSKSTGKKWIPDEQYEAYKNTYGYDKLKPDDPMYELPFYDNDWKVLYTFSIYNSMLVLTGNDIKPPNMSMMWLGITFLIGGLLTSANIFGTFSSMYAGTNVRA